MGGAASSEAAPAEVEKEIDASGAGAEQAPRRDAESEAAAEVALKLLGDGVRAVPVIGGSVVLVGAGLLDRVPEELRSWSKASKFVIISDDVVAPLHAARLQAAFSKQGIEPLLFTVPNGEASKNREQKAKIEDFMIEHRCLRDTVVVALGGGVVGDLAGFVASTYYRGVPVVQIPTSVMAMVDSSVGGKTAIDVPGGKNLVGAFHQPRRVYCDMDLVETLPIRQVRNGLCESIKMGVIRCAPLFEYMEQYAAEIQKLDRERLGHVIYESIRLKAEVVAIDEKENGLRAILNWGHTVGHAVEAYSIGTLLHGECVAIGCNIEAQIARDLGYFPNLHLGRLLRLFKAYSLPSQLPEHLSVDDLMKKIAVDKKNIGNATRITVVKRIGDSFDTARPVDSDMVRAALFPSALVVPKDPPAPLSGTVPVPGSKSISNRVLLLAALGEGVCRLRGLLQSDDTAVMMEALKEMGVSFAWEEEGAVLAVTGAGGKMHTPKGEIYLGNAGTASRFLTTACTILNGDSTTLTGDKRMQERPAGDLVDSLRSCGCDIAYLKSEGSLPISIKAGGLKGGRVELKATTSSQFVSSLLLSAPFARTPVTLVLKGEVVSRPYIDMTITLMRQFGVEVKEPEGQPEVTFEIPRGVYKNPPAHFVEPDASSATYPLAVAAITGGTVTVKGLPSREDSLQGDAGFPWLLERMGCTVNVEKDGITLKGPPPGQTLKAVDVDMNTMTDAFLTAAALMATVPGETSRITNIANQRVKECNRIEAMVTELGKCGIVCRETADGIEVDGKRPSEIKGAVIHCYNDHRVAMSFGVLGCVAKGVLIADKVCVDKTYPEFWGHLRIHMGASFDTTVASHAPAANAPRGHGAPAAAEVPATSQGPPEVLVLVGMRGAGKSSLAKASAEALGVQAVDLDEVLEKEVGEPVRSFVEKSGWAEFRKRELEVLQRYLKPGGAPKGTVVACGGGVVETPEGVAALKAHRGVMMVDRHVEDLMAYLESPAGTTPTRPPIQGETPRDIYERRLPLYLECSTYVFTIPKGESDWGKVNEAFLRFVRFVRGDLDVPLGENTFFLGLTFPSIEAQDPALLKEVAKGSTALELRVDLLQSREAGSVRAQIAALRAAVPELPVLFTVRSKDQGGAFEGTDAEYAALCEVGIQAGCELIDVETTRSESTISQLLAARGPARAVCSYHDFDRMPSPDELRALFKRCARGGDADLAKVVVKATCNEDSLAVQAAAADACPPGVPYVAICLGDKGRLSRVLNRTMTPVAHPALPAKAAPGQLSVEEILQCRAVLGL